ncbi:unnamed protein product, partial [Cyprideis torosa]
IQIKGFSKAKASQKQRLLKSKGFSEASQKHQKSPEVKVEEVQTLLRGLDDPSQFQMHGVHVAGQR